jgi:hypothetical protein
MVSLYILVSIMQYLSIVFLLFNFTEIKHKFKPISQAKCTMFLHVMAQLMP